MLLVVPVSMFHIKSCDCIITSTVSNVNCWIDVVSSEKLLIFIFNSLNSFIIFSIVSSTSICAILENYYYCIAISVK